MSRKIIFIMIIHNTVKWHYVGYCNCAVRNSIERVSDQMLYQTLHGTALNSIGFRFLKYVDHSAVQNIRPMWNSIAECFNAIHPEIDYRRFHTAMQLMNHLQLLASHSSLWFKALQEEQIIAIKLSFAEGQCS